MLLSNEFYCDAHLPIAVSNFFTDKGHNSVHTSELKLGNKTSDKVINQLSENENRIVITKDTDFLHSQLILDIPQKLILIKTGNISTKNLVRIFENQYEEIMQLIKSRNLVEIHPKSNFVD